MVPALMPRFQARTKRFLEAWADRDRFSLELATVENACVRLKFVGVPADDVDSWIGDGPMSADRQRWVDQIDESTKYMLDNHQRYVLGWPSWIRGRAEMWSVVAREVWVSDLHLKRKVDVLTRMVAPIRQIYFGRWWQDKINACKKFDQIMGELGRVHEHPFPWRPRWRARFIRSADD
jgi:hypothetical protein